MRLIGLIAALALSAAAAAATAEPMEVMPTVPHGVAVVAWMPRDPYADMRRQADNAARARCRDAGGKARFVRSALLQRTRRHGQEGVYLYDCLR